MTTVPQIHERTGEPLCCGEPMVHNSFTREYECSSAYFALVDEGFDDGWTSLERVTADDVGPDMAETLGHWRKSRISDELGGVA